MSRKIVISLFFLASSKKNSYNSKKLLVPSRSDHLGVYKIVNLLFRLVLLFNTASNFVLPTVYIFVKDLGAFFCMLLYIFVCVGVSENTMS